MAVLTPCRREGSVPGAAIRQAWHSSWKLTPKQRMPLALMACSLLSNDKSDGSAAPSLCDGGQMPRIYGLPVRSLRGVVHA